MIEDYTARRMGVKFFREQGHLKLAGRLDTDCLDDIFASAVKSLGKSRVWTLYNKLPKQLKVFVLLMLEGVNNKYLENSLDELYDEFCLVIDSKRPERTKRFTECIEKAEKILVKYFKGRLR